MTAKKPKPAMMHEKRLTLPDETVTSRLGAALGARLGGGDTVLLSGEIGAGKSHLARALIQSLIGPDTVVPSPSFTLVQSYEGETPIWHVDLYRIADASEVIELGLDDALGEALVLVEWPERLGDWPKPALTITLTEAGGGRLATMTWQDAQWDARLQGLAEELRDD